MNLFLGLSSICLTGCNRSYFLSPQDAVYLFKVFSPKCECTLTTFHKTRLIALFFGPQDVVSNFDVFQTFGIWIFRIFSTRLVLYFLFPTRHNFYKISLNISKSLHYFQDSVKHFFFARLPRILHSFATRLG